MTHQETKYKQNGTKILKLSQNENNEPSLRDKDIKNGQNSRTVKKWTKQKIKTIKKSRLDK